MKFALYALMAAGISLWWAGCNMFVAQVATDAAGAIERPTTVAAWLDHAPEPETVACSVEAATAPNAVKFFNIVASQVAEVYAAVYADAKGEDAKAAVPEGATEQDVITMKYQASMMAIDACRKTIGNYISALGSSDAGTLADPLLKTTTLLQLGKDVEALEAQLAEAEMGAGLILRERVGALKAQK